MPQNQEQQEGDPEMLRKRAAAEERQAILRIIEEHARRLAHGHGATGAQILQQVADAIERRGAE